MTKIMFSADGDHNQCGCTVTILWKIKVMSVVSQKISTEYPTRKYTVSNFLAWSEAQEYDRLLWVGISLGTHGCIITPLTIMALLLFSNGDIPMISFTLATLSMVMVLVTNLAALPTKITIPVFVLSILTDVAVLAALLV